MIGGHSYSKFEKICYGLQTEIINAISTLSHSFLSLVKFQSNSYETFFFFFLGCCIIWKQGTQYVSMNVKM